jgi:hypothetical protein
MTFDTGEGGFFSQGANYTGFFLIVLDWTTGRSYGSQGDSLQELKVVLFFCLSVMLHRLQYQTRPLPWIWQGCRCLQSFPFLY